MSPGPISIRVDPFVKVFYRHFRPFLLSFDHAKLKKEPTHSFWGHEMANSTKEGFQNNYLQAHIEQPIWIDLVFDHCVYVLCALEFVE